MSEEKGHDGLTTEERLWRSDDMAHYFKAMYDDADLEIKRLREENEAYGHRVGCLRYQANIDRQRQTELLEKLDAIRMATTANNDEVQRLKMVAEVQRGQIEYYMNVIKILSPDYEFNAECCQEKREAEMNLEENKEERM